MPESKPKVLSPLRKLETAVSQNVFLLMGIASSLFFLFSVPQISALWVPSFSGLSSRAGLWIAAFGLVIFAFLYLYIVTVYLFIFPATGRGGETHRWFFWLPRLVNGFLLYVAKKLVSLTSSRLSLLPTSGFFLLGFVLLISSFTYRDALYHSSGAALSFLSIWMMLTSCWFGVGYVLQPKELVVQDAVLNRLAVSVFPGRYTHRDNETKAIHRRSSWQACGEVLSWLLVMFIFCECFWVLAIMEIPGASLRIYSAAGVLYVALMWPVIGALTDFLQRASPIPARLLLVVILAVGFGWSLSADHVVKDSPIGIQQSPSMVNNSIDKDREWLRALERRIDSIPPGPAVIVVASGGGSRAAIFTALVLDFLASEEMQDLPEARLSNEGSQSRGTWADHLVLMSSVSGGSIAVADYIAQQAKSKHLAESDRLKFSTHQELTLEAKKRLEKLQEVEGVSETERKLLSRVKVAISEFAETELKKDPDKKASPGDVLIVERAFSSQLADRVAVDFMAPVVRGFITPLMKRGHGLFQFWNQHFQWEGIVQSSFAFDDKALAQPVPLALLNTTDADGGRRVIMGFPMLPAGFLIGSPRNDYDQNLASERLEEFSPVCLSDYIDEGHPNLSLTRAVRLSSNFPLGFQVCELNEKSVPPLKMSKDAPWVRGLIDRSRLRLLDGGVVDNTGLDSIHSVCQSLRQQAANSPSGRAAVILEKLRSRGVVIIEIDSGAKPAGVDGSNLFGALKQPLSALNSAAYTNSLRSSDRQIDDIEDILTDSSNAALLETIRSSDPYEGDVLPNILAKLGLAQVSGTDIANALPSLLDPQSAFRSESKTVLSFRFSCSHLFDADGDVMTALALSPRDKASVYAAFCVEALAWKDRLLAASRNYRNTIQAYQELRDMEDSGDRYRDVISDYLRQTYLEFSLLNATEAGSDRVSIHRKRIAFLLVGLFQLTRVADERDVLDADELHVPLNALAASLAEQMNVDNGPLIVGAVSPPLDKKRNYDESIQDALASLRDSSAKNQKRSRVDADLLRSATERQQGEAETRRDRSKTKRAVNERGLFLKTP